MDILVGLMTFGIGCFFALKIYNGYRTGEMQLLIHLSGSDPYLFRKFEPILFWVTAAFNTLMAVSMFACVIIVVVRRAQ
jgi:hypothetical protein